MISFRPSHLKSDFVFRSESRRAARSSLAITRGGLQRLVEKPPGIAVNAEQPSKQFGVMSSVTMQWIEQIAQDLFFIDDRLVTIG